MQGAENPTPPSAVAKLRASKPTKFIVLKSGTPQNQSPVVTKVIRAPGPATIANKINVTQTWRATGNINAPSASATSSSPTMVSTRKAYERHGTEEFLKRFTSVGGSVKTVVKGKEDVKVDAGGPMAAKKTIKPSPTQINIFSALDEELSNPKKKEPPKKLVPRIELSRTYQPPPKAPTVQPQPILKSQESKENEDESFFDKFNKSKDNWLLDFSGSPTKSPIKPGGSIAAVSDDSSEDNFPVECKVQLARVIPNPDQLLKAEKRIPEDSSGVINISSSSELEEPRDEETDPNSAEIEADVALMASESDSSEPSTKDSKSDCGSQKKGLTVGEKELSFVEARSRRKRKPPTYFGYEDHELSYNHGLNLVINSQGQDETDNSKKKKPSTDIGSYTSSTTTAVSKRKFRSTSRKGGDSDDEDSKSTSSEQSLKTKKASRSYSIASDSSDEEVLTNVAKKERSQRRGTSSDRENATTHKPLSSTTIQDDLKTTAFRLYYKDVLDSVQSDETDSEKITKVITQMWFDLDKSQREKFETQARQLSQISLPPSPLKVKPEVKLIGQSTVFDDDKNSSKENVKCKNKERKKSKSKSPLKEAEVGILSKVAADLQSTTDESSAGSEDSSTSSEEGSPIVRPKTKKLFNSARSSPPPRKPILPDSTDTSESEPDSSDSSGNEKRIVKTKVEEVSKTAEEVPVLLKPKPAKSTKSPTQQPAVAKKEPVRPKVCFNCPKEAIECSLWSSDGQYCSISCCVLHCKKLYNDWVAERKRKAELEREQSEIEALKHAKDFFCIQTEEDETETNEKNIDQDLSGLDTPQVIEIEAE